MKIVFSKILLLLTVFFFNLNFIFSQNIIFKDTSNFLVKNSSELNEVRFTPLYYKDTTLIFHLKAILRSNGRASLFMIDIKNGNMLEINQDDKKNKFLPYGGYLVENNKIIIFREKTRNYRKSKYYIDFLNFDSGQHTSNELDINLKGEKVIGEVTGTNLFYLLSIIKDRKTLKIRTIKKDLSIKSDLVKINEENFILPIWDKKLSNFSYSESEIQEEKIPFSSYQLQSKNKIYFSENNIVITYETSAESIIVNIDPVSWEITSQKIPKSSVTNKVSELPSFLRSNSFLQKNKLFQFVGNKKEFNLSAYDKEKSDLIFSKTLRDTDKLFSLDYPYSIKDKSFKKKYRQVMNFQNTGIYVKELAEAYLVNITGYSSGSTITFRPSVIESTPAAPIMIDDMENLLKLYISKESHDIQLINKYEAFSTTVESKEENKTKNLEMNFKVDGLRYFGFYDLNNSSYIIKTLSNEKSSHSHGKHQRPARNAACH